MAILEPGVMLEVSRVGPEELIPGFAEPIVRLDASIPDSGQPALAFSVPCLGFWSSVAISRGAIAGHRWTRWASPHLAKLRAQRSVSRCWNCLAHAGRALPLRSLLNHASSIADDLPFVFCQAGRHDVDSPRAHAALHRTSNSYACLAGYLTALRSTHTPTGRNTKTLGVDRNLLARKRISVARKQKSLAIDRAEAGGHQLDVVRRSVLPVHDRISLVDEATRHVPQANFACAQHFFACAQANFAQGRPDSARR